MSKYSVVSYLDPESTIRIRELQHKLFELTGSRACLDHWLPHITVGDGLILKDKNLTLMEQSLSSLVAAKQPFKVRLQSFGGTNNWVPGKGDHATNYVLWINVPVHHDLHTLIDDIRQISKDQEVWYEMPTPYVPHVTIAFHDLSTEGYEKGRVYLGDVTIDVWCTIDHVALVEKLVGQDKQYQRYNFAD